MYSIQTDRSQNHSLIYYDRYAQTVADALYQLQRISNTMICYRQYIPIVLHSEDILLDYRVEEDLAYITIPLECTCVTNIRNNRGCKMVMYYQDLHTPMKEVNVTPRMYVRPGTTIIVYTRALTNLVVTMDVFISTPMANL